jgi:hypothetical protein
MQVTHLQLAMQHSLHFLLPHPAAAPASTAAEKQASFSCHVSPLLMARADDNTSPCQGCTSRIQKSLSHTADMLVTLSTAEPASTQPRRNPGASILLKDDSEITRL